MDLTQHIDYFLQRLSRRKIMMLAWGSWGFPPNSLRVRLEIRLLELILSLCMPKPEETEKRLEDGRYARGYPVTYHNEHILVFPAYLIVAPRVYVLFNAMRDLLKKR